MLNLPIYLCSLGALLFVLNSCMGFSDLSLVQRGRFGFLFISLYVDMFEQTYAVFHCISLLSLSFVSNAKYFQQKKERDLHSVMSRYFDMIPLSCTSKNPPPSDSRFGWRSVITMASVFNLSH